MIRSVTVQPNRLSCYLPNTQASSTRKWFNSLQHWLQKLYMLFKYVSATPLFSQVHRVYISNFIHFFNKWYKLELQHRHSHFGERIYVQFAFICTCGFSEQRPAFQFQFELKPPTSIWLLCSDTSAICTCSCGFTVLYLSVS